MRKETTSEAVLRKLRRMIMTMELAPGSVVTELGLSDMLNCSRTPVREALQRLTSENLVVAGPRGGVIISDVSVLDLGQLLEAMEEVGATAVRLAAQRATKHDLDALRGIVGAAEQALANADYAGLTEQDVAFHQALYMAGHNRYIADVAGPLHRLFARFAYLSYARMDPSEVHNPLSEHAAVIAAIEDKDVSESKRLLAEHFRGMRDRLRGLLV
ncbi:MAG: GntR family transcriptional regulator [Thermoleophilia bacterium]|nr:GntR family transcriptional regulator [Thermoleophilia bacterium]